MNKIKRIIFYPGVGYNSYIYNMQKILGADYEVISVKKRLWFLANLNLLFVPKNGTVVLINWIENIFFKKRITFLSMLLCRTFLNFLKFKYEKIVYFKHNLSPHKAENRERGLELVENIEKMCDYVFVHNCFSPGIYMPHPLYKKINGLDRNIEEVNSLMSRVSGSMVIFGTMHRYKGIDKFLKINKDKLRIVLLGEIPEKEYQNTLKSYESDQVKIYDKFLEDGELQKVLACSMGVIVINEKMPLVSGSFMFALSINIPVHCMSEEYLVYLKKIKVANSLYLYENYDDLINNINSPSQSQNDLEYFNDKKLLDIFRGGIS